MARRAAEFQLSRELLHQLTATGSPIDSSVADNVRAKDVSIDQIGDIHGSKVFELEDGRVGLVADLAITNLTNRAIQVLAIEPRSRVFDDAFELLTPVQMKGGCDRQIETYRFPGRYRLEMPFDQSLNQLFLKHGLLKSKRRHEGMLLGIGGLMPLGLMHGQWIEIPLVIIAADSAEYTTTVKLWTERLLDRRKPVRRRTSLFEGSDSTQRLRLAYGEPVTANAASSAKSDLNAFVTEEKRTIHRGWTK